jgi:beta-galactosidase
MKILKFTTYLFLALSLGTLAGNAQEKKPDWENPAMFNQNKEKPRTYFIPFRTVNEALNKNKNQSVFYKSLNGNWKFNWVRKPADRPVDFYKPDYDVSEWNEIPVPSNWERICRLQSSGFG